MPASSGWMSARAASLCSCDPRGRSGTCPGRRSRLLVRRGDSRLSGCCVALCSPDCPARAAASRDRREQENTSTATSRPAEKPSLRLSMMMSSPMSPVEKPAQSPGRLGNWCRCVCPSRRGHFAARRNSLWAGSGYSMWWQVSQSCPIVLPSFVLWLSSWHRKQPGEVHVADVVRVGAELDVHLRKHVAPVDAAGRADRLLDVLAPRHVDLRSPASGRTRAARVRSPRRPRPAMG